MRHSNDGGPIRRTKYVRLFLRAMNYLVTEGPVSILRRAWTRLRLKRARYRLQLPDARELQRQRETRFPRPMRVSLVVLPGPSEAHLQALLRSVREQTWADWELCLPEDGSPAPTGDYVALLRADDQLHPSALYEIASAICEQDADLLYTDEAIFHSTPEDAREPLFKPDFSPDYLRSCNYIGSFFVFRRDLLDASCDLRDPYDLLLRLTEKARRIVHLPKVLYFRRAGAAPEDGKQALAAHLGRLGLEGQVLDASQPGAWRVQYTLRHRALVSILIPNKDHADDLQKCVDSIRDRSTYPHWEIIVIENNSAESRTFSCYEELQKDDRIQVVTWPGEFNYSAINNFGRQHARGDYILLLNNDIEVITPDWMEQMIMFAQREDVGAVGCKLYFPDDTIQHAGVTLGIGGVAAHTHAHLPRTSPGYMGRLTVALNLTAVTAACMLLRAEVWDQVQGLDESFAVAFNDVDLCLRIRQAGYLIVWTPFAELYHYESKSRGMDTASKKRQRFLSEMERFKTRWAAELEAGDPYYNPNLSLEALDFSIKS